MHERDLLAAVVTPVVALLALLPVAADASAQITEIVDETGDGQGKTLSSPRYVAVDGAGNAFVSGGAFVQGNVFRITPGGDVTCVLDVTGDGLGNPYQFGGALAVDGEGNVYAAGLTSNNVFMISPDGSILEIIDETGDGMGNTLTGPNGLAVDDLGNVYVAGGGYPTGNAFKITDPAGASVITEIIDGSGDGGGNPLLFPAGIAVDALGRVYLASTAELTSFYASSVFQITPGGVITEFIDETGDGLGNMLLRALAIAVDASGDVYVSGFDSSNAFKITDPAGANVITQIIDSSGDGGGHALSGAHGIAVDQAGNAYLAGTESDNAFKIAPDGVIAEIIDGAGNGMGDLLDATTGVAVGADGSVYVTGRDSRNAFRIAPDCPDAIVLDFQTEDDQVTPLVNGQDISSPPEFGNRLAINGSGLNSGAAIFDSSPAGPNADGPDPDLLVDQGNILILQEQPWQTVAGIFDIPDDSHLSGTLRFDFPQPVELRSIDLIDIDAPDQDCRVTLLNLDGATRTYFVPSGWTTDIVDDGGTGVLTLDLTTLDPQVGFAATALASDEGAFQPQGVVRMEVFLTSSGGVDNLSWCAPSAPPSSPLAPGVERYGCGINPIGSISVISGTSTLGSILVIGIDNPMRTQAVGSVPFLAVSALPKSNYPCGTTVAGYGMSFPYIGELLLGSSPLLVLSGPARSDVDSPAEIALALPGNAALSGVVVYAQGLLLDPSPGAQPRMGLTEALRLTLSSD